MKYVFCSEYFKTFRVAAGYSQKDLAAAAGVHLRTICAYEQGSRSAPDICTLAQIADVLGAPLKGFLRTIPDRRKR